MTSPLPSNSEAFVTRDQGLPLEDQIRKTRGDVYEYITAPSALSARLDGLEHRLANIEVIVANIDASTRV